MKRIFLISAYRDDSDFDSTDFVYPVCFFREKPVADEFAKEANAIATKIEPPGGGSTTHKHPLDPEWCPGHRGEKRPTRYVVDEVRVGRRRRAAS